MATGRGKGEPYISSSRVRIRDLPKGPVIDYKITIIWPRPPSPPNPPQKFDIEGTITLPPGALPKGLGK
jgi:hypothetical protein